MSAHASCWRKVCLIVLLLGGGMSVFAENAESENSEVDSLLEACLSPLNFPLDGPYREEILQEILFDSGKRISALLSQPRPWQLQVEAAHLPAWFSLLPLAISYGNTLVRDAYTAGLWGLTEVAAIRYGLLITDNYDERHHPQKATEAALCYWFDLRPQYNDDWTALMAFVNTPTVMNNALVRMKSETRPPSWLKPDFPVNFASLMYWERVLAAPTSDSLSSSALQSSITAAAPKLEKCLAKKPVFLSLLCPALSMTEETFRAYNPSVLAGDCIEASCPIYLPKDLVSLFKKHLPDVYVQSEEYIRKEEEAYRKAAAAAAAPLIYKIRPGDTLSGVAQRYRVRVSDIRRWNNLKSDRIYAGQKLKIYKKY